MSLCDTMTKLIVNNPTKEIYMKDNQNTHTHTMLNLIKCSKKKKSYNAHAVSFCKQNHTNCQTLA